MGEAVGRDAQADAKRAAAVRLQQKRLIPRFDGDDLLYEFQADAVGQRLANVNRGRFPLVVVQVQPTAVGENRQGGFRAEGLQAGGPAGKDRTFAELRQSHRSALPPMLAPRLVQAILQKGPCARHTELDASTYCEVLPWLKRDLGHDHAVVIDGSRQVIGQFGGAGCTGMQRAFGFEHNLLTALADDAQLLFPTVPSAASR